MEEEKKGVSDLSFVLENIENPPNAVRAFINQKRGVKTAIIDSDLEAIKKFVYAFNPNEENMRFFLLEVAVESMIAGDTRGIVDLLGRMIKFSHTNSLTYIIDYLLLCGDERTKEMLRRKLGNGHELSSKLDNYRNSKSFRELFIFLIDYPVRYGLKKPNTIPYSKPSFIDSAKIFMHRVILRRKWGLRFFLSKSA